MLIRALARAGIDFVLIGGHAVAVHGYERATRDVDVVYSTDAESCDRLAITLRDLGAIVMFADHQPPDSGITGEWLSAGGHFGFATDAGPIDALSSVAGFDYVRLARDAIRTELGGASIRVCSYEDLVTLKRSGGRPRDQVDLEELREARATD